MIWTELTLFTNARDITLTRYFWQGICPPTSNSLYAPPSLPLGGGVGGGGMQAMSSCLPACCLGDTYALAGSSLTQTTCIHLGTLLIMILLFCTFCRRIWWTAKLCLLMLVSLIQMVWNLTTSTWTWMGSFIPVATLRTGDWQTTTFMAYT